MTVTTTREVPPVTTLLLDLDGTFLDVDMPAFLDLYCSHAGRRFVSPRELPRITRAMAAALQKVSACRAGTRTLDRVFVEGFSPAVGRSPLEVRKVLSTYHRAEFEQLRRLTAPRRAARPLLEKALSLGYELVIATNPVFLLEAIRARIRWAGLEGIPLALVTSAELMRCAKPHRRYFEQVLKLLGRRADECLMVGDDPVMDLPAGELGIGTWLAIPEPEEPLAVPGADCRGTLEELAAWLEERGPVGACRPTGKGAGRAGARGAKGTRETAASPAPDVFSAVQQLTREIDAVSPAEERMLLEPAGTLRGAMQAGRMEPRSSLWLWIRIMRVLAERHRADTVFGCITPDDVFLGAGEAIRIEKPAAGGGVYAAPEIRAGLPPARQGDIYSMGVILFELAAGSLARAGRNGPSELHADIPTWLDELILRCMEPDLEKRFRAVDEVAEALLSMKGPRPA